MTNLVVTTQALQAALIAALLYVFGREFQRDRLHYWGFSWGALSLYYFSLVIVEIPAISGMRSVATWIEILGVIAALWSCIWLIEGALALDGVRPPRSEAWSLGLSAAAVFAVMFASASSTNPVVQGYGRWMLRCFGASIAYLFCAIQLARLDSKREIGRILLASGFGLYGLKLLHYFGLSAYDAVWGAGAGRFVPEGWWSLSNWTWSDIFAQGAMGLGTIAWLLEREHDHALETATRLQHLACYDPITTLPNRALLEDRGTAALFQAGDDPVSLLLIDLDHFNKINSSFGHVVGDAVLRIVASRIQGMLGAGDALARVGADEFAILSPGTARTDAVALGERLLVRLREGLQSGSHEVFLTASIGVAAHPTDGTSFGDLLKHSQLAKAKAKDAGGDQLRIFDPSLSKKALARLSFETIVRRALAAGEFELHYQPVWDIQSGRVEAVEALIRWRDPDAGLRKPAEFLSEIEESGLSRVLVPWTLRAACHQAVAFQRFLPHLRMAVNLDGPTFQRADLLSEVFGAIETSGLRPTSLELEITETTAMRDIDSAYAILQRLRKRGVSVALDDFGTGYSSLSQLQAFPIDTLKIDGSFVRGLDRPGPRAIVRAVVTLAEALNLRVVAEGVETQAQRQALGEIGCGFGQGYLVSAPLLPPEMEDLLTRHVSTSTSHQAQ